MKRERRGTMEETGTMDKADNRGHSKMLSLFQLCSPLFLFSLKSWNLS